MANKIDRLMHLQSEIHPHIIILTEHGLTEEKLKNTRLPGYTLKANFSRQIHKLGGVAIYVVESMDSSTKPLDVTIYSKEETCEIAMVKVALKKEQLYVMGIYRPPKSKLDESLDILSRMIDETKIENHRIIIMGDINVDILQPNKNSRYLNETLASYNIERLPIPATRITPNSTSSIDCICTNLDNEMLRAQVIHAGISDHSAQLCTLLTHTKKPDSSSSIRRHFNEENMNVLKSILQRENWKNVYDAQTVNNAYNNYITTITAAMDTACPQKKTRHKGRPKPKNFLQDKEATKLKDAYLESLRRYEQRGTEQNKMETAKTKKKYDLRLKMLKRQASADHINNAGNKSKALWQVINQERAQTNTAPNQIKLKINGKEIEDPHKVAEHMNQFFTNIARRLLDQQQQPEPQPTAATQTDHELLQLDYTHEEEVRGIIKALKPKTSAGVDNISAKLLKHCSKALTAPLTHIINKSLESGEFPSALKLAKTYPKYKSGCPMEASNYRPISLISTFSKVIERIALKRVLDYCNHHSLLTDKQHGFIQGKSTTTAIIKLAEFVIDHLEKGKLVTSIMLDFSKAFDCLGHDLIIHKLETLGIKGTAGLWFKSYLEGRSQVVELKHSTNGVTQEIRSNPLPLTRGVPQGSVLGPVLFILFTNDLPHYLDEYCTTLMFADDTTLLLATDSADRMAINSYTALNMAYQFCHQNDLVVNKNKTCQLAFGRRGNEVPTLPEVATEDQTKFLGVIVDKNNTWNQHVDALAGKLNTSLYVIKRIKHISNLTTARTAYHALFESHLRYGLVIWGSTTAENLLRVLRIQKRAIRILAEIGPRDSCKGEFKNLKIMTSVALYIREVILYADGEVLPRGEDLHKHNTRHASRYNLPAHHLTLYEKKPSYMGVKLHNLLPEELRSRTGNGLKAELDKWLLNRPFYTIEEFKKWRDHE